MAACLSLNMAAMTAQLRKHEGERLTVYTDSIGLPTIGVGRELSHHGISREESAMLLARDIAESSAAVCEAFPWAANLDEVRQRVLVDLAFNMGIDRLKGFTLMLAALQQHDFEQAAVQLWASKWSKQVQVDRSHRLTAMLRTGQEQP